jgi:hypothetical protein
MFLFFLLFLACDVSAAGDFEECSVMLTSGVATTLQCLQGQCHNNSCACTTCPCYGLFHCTCNRGNDGCSSSCFVSPRGTACDIGARDGANAAPVFMVVFLVLSLAAVPTFALCSTKCLAWRRARRQKKNRQRTKAAAAADTIPAAATVEGEASSRI